MATTRVLIIEDDADINNIVATHLTRAGYTCTQAFPAPRQSCCSIPATPPWPTW